MIPSGKPYQAEIGTMDELGEPSVNLFLLLMELLVPTLIMASVHMELIFPFV